MGARGFLSVGITGGKVTSPAGFAGRIIGDYVKKKAKEIAQPPISEKTVTGFTIRTQTEQKSFSIQPPKTWTVGLKDQSQMIKQSEKNFTILKQLEDSNKELMRQMNDLKRDVNHIVANVPAAS